MKIIANKKNRAEKMTYFDNSDIDEKILKQFRNIIDRNGVEFDAALKDAILEYIAKHSKSDNAKRAKSEKTLK